MRVPFDTFIRDLLAAQRQGARTKPVAAVAAKGAPDAPHVLLFSPHPDDECITGALPLRLLRQCGFRITNIPMTFGSRIARRKARRTELTLACRALGFELYEGPVDVATLLRLYRPAALFVPHADDLHPTHIAVHKTVMEGLRKAGKGIRTLVIETEFWQPMTRPNLMVESSPRDVAALVNALALHKGEVERNPYHLRLPAWMQDNVRRGAEVVGAQGAKAPAMTFATLYRLTPWNAPALCLPSSKSPSILFGAAS